MLALLLVAVSFSCAQKPTAEQLMQQSREAVDRGEIDEAIAVADKGIQQFPDSSDFYFQKAIILSGEAQQKFDKAIPLFTKAIACDEAKGIEPSYVYLLRGFCYRKLGEIEKGNADTRKADGMYAKRIEDDPDGPDAKKWWSRRIEAQFDLENWSKCVAMYEKAKPLDPEKVRVPFLLEQVAIAAYEIKDLQLALDLAYEVVDENPKACECWRVIGDVWYYELEVDSAIAAYQKAYAIKQLPEYRTSLGSAYVFRAVIEICTLGDSALHKAVDSLRLAKGYLRENECFLGLYNSIVNGAKFSAENDPQNPIGHLVYALMTEEGDGLPYLEKALQLDPENPHIKYDIACRYFDAGKFADAIPLFSSVMQYVETAATKPQSLRVETIAYNRGCCYDETGNRLKAKQDYELAVRLTEQYAKNPTQLRIFALSQLTNCLNYPLEEFPKDSKRALKLAEGLYEAAGDFDFVAVLPYAVSLSENRNPKVWPIIAQFEEMVQNTVPANDGDREYLEGRLAFSKKVRDLAAERGIPNPNND